MEIITTKAMRSRGRREVHAGKAALPLQHLCDRVCVSLLVKYSRAFQLAVASLLTPAAGSGEMHPLPGKLSRLSSSIPSTAGARDELVPSAKPVFWARQGQKSLQTEMSLGFSDSCT